MVHEQKFKDLISSTCQVSVERSMLDLESEVQWFNTHWGNILLMEFFVLQSKASDANIGIIGDSKSYLSGLPRLRINVWGYFGGFFLALSWIKCRKVTTHKCPSINVLCVAMHECWNVTQDGWQGKLNQRKSSENWIDGKLVSPVFQVQKDCHSVHRFIFPHHPS